MTYEKIFRNKDGIRLKIKICYIKSEYVTARWDWYTCEKGKRKWKSIVTIELDNHKYKNLSKNERRGFDNIMDQIMQKGYYYCYCGRSVKFNNNCSCGKENLLIKLQR